MYVCVCVVGWGAGEQTQKNTMIFRLYILQHLVKTNLRGPSQVAQLVGASPHMPKEVASSIPSQGTYPGWGFDPQWGSVQEATDQCLSVCFSLSLSLSLSQINKNYPWVRIKNNN